MLDPRTLIEDRERIIESCRKRRVDVDLDSVIAAHETYNALITQQGQLNQRRNEHQKAGKRKLEPEERKAHGLEGKRLKDEVGVIEERLRESQNSLYALLEPIPNLIHPEVPEGGEHDYTQIRTWGDIPSFDFAPKDHLQICEDLDLVDFESGSKVAGAKFYFLKNEAALLDLALQRFAIDAVIEEGFIPHITPDLARPEIIEGLGFSPRGPETQIYSIEGHDLCLVGTAEITLGGMYAGKIFNEDELPLKLAGVSHCFRTEAGSHGRESKGLYRVHQFTKTEMFVFSVPEQSEAIHSELLRIEEKIFQALEIPYQVIDVASGDLGAPAYRKFDLEAWMPGRGSNGDWGEITSTSNCTDYQARRLKIRVRRKQSKKNEVLHTLNGTAISNARALVPLLENHQRADGSIGIPKALQPYLGRDRIGPR